jgi:hypothetical protein
LDFFGLIHLKSLHKKHRRNGFYHEVIGDCVDVDTRGQKGVDYCPIEHLAKTIGLSKRKWQDIRLAMFTACFDASGHERDPNTPNLVVAGFISTADLWIRFTEQWENRLMADGISYFHAAAFISCRENFKEGWRGNISRQKRLCSDLVEIIRANTFRIVGCIIVNKDLNALTRAQRKLWKLNAYSFAAMHCMIVSSLWHRDSGGTQPIEFIFEDGDFGRGEMLDCCQQYLHFRPQLRPKKDTLQKGILRARFIPLQAADFLAYTMFRARGNNHPEILIDPAEEFYKMPTEPIPIVDNELLKRYAERMKVWDVMQAWPPKD